ncbi:hypothetical protein [Micromonospora rubida]|uniref:hypothetical protein n=1 Tax=Micromonospora rubida TaxID=2697657 RepID=UPI00137882FF|nr:hypothetical protein [Micromonospora rubida]NBE80253.1 hypothetical protein [Micromonospora rubida]
MDLNFTDISTNDGGRLVSIRSAHFKDRYLRMDSKGYATPSGPGGGEVNCQTYVGSYERFILRRQPDSSFSVESARFPNVFLRMVAFGLTAATEKGGGLVNCQFGRPDGDHERFKFVYGPSGFTIESITFSNVFLRMDASDFNEEAHYGGGIVNCQFGAFEYEKFLISWVD